MKLSPEHRQLIRLLAEAAVEQFLEETEEEPLNSIAKRDRHADPTRPVAQ